MSDSDGCLSADALEQARRAISEQTTEDLLALAKRFSRSHAALEELLQELQVQLNETVELMMREMKKLNIGANNTVEPSLEEGPLDFLGRFWETLRPRDTAYAASEHIGELRGITTPAQSLDAAPQAFQDMQEFGRHATQQLTRAFESASSSSFWGKAQGYLDEKRNELASAVAALGDKDVQSQGSPWLMMHSDDPSAMLGMDWAAPAMKSEARQKKKKKRRDAAADCVSSTSETGPDPSSASSSAAPQAMFVTVPSLESGMLPPVSQPVQGAYSSDSSALAALDTAETTEPASHKQQTVLIDALVTIGDGSVLTLHVYASDRCKDVAASFVSEHSLKASFEKPLAAYLQKVESEAESFPATVEIDLLELASHGH
eukprot:TRINITY_DN17490_c0_g1_i1.p1 TRINITY_DN17490_c0_g1~~TRINITY_DN17490_c0_g1_i1.p1  ORF type:complete len:393 (+),score=78.51 TRINITY_DN17490_c0_g1_i1:56-1180(+)